MGRAEISRKQFVWLEHYFQCWNATEAARCAGYRCPRISGPENLHKPALARAIRAWVADARGDRVGLGGALTDGARLYIRRD